MQHTRAAAIALFVATSACGVVEPVADSAARTTLHAGKSASPLAVTFSDCVESIGVGLAPTAAVQALVPAGFHVVGEGGPVTPLVVRTARCGGIAVDGSKSKDGSVVQIGPVIVPPDFTADIDNYTLWYYTSEPKLAHALSALGIDAQHVQIDYSLQGANLAVTIKRPGSPPLAVTGTVVPSQTPAGSFTANWWVRTNAGTVKMQTVVPTIFIGSANLTLTTSANSALAALVGGTSFGFPIVQQFNTFSTAQLTATVAP